MDYHMLIHQPKQKSKARDPQEEPGQFAEDPVESAKEIMLQRSQPRS